MYRKEIEGFTGPHGDEMTEDIYTLCRINSEKMPHVEGKPYGEGLFQALQTALNMTEGYGFTIRNYDNYVGTADLNDKERQLDILTHLDVVSAGEGWTEIKSFELVVEDGKLFGCGTADDKGPAVAAPYAIRAVKELDILLDKNIRLILGMDEECGSSDIVNYYDKEDEVPTTFSPDAEFPATNIEKGRLEGHFHASFQASEAMPRLVGAEAGIKASVVPGKARAVVEGVDLKTSEAAAEAVEKETGISFMLEGGLPVMTVTAQGEGAHASTLQEGKDALTGLLVYLIHLPLAKCPQMSTVKNLLKSSPHGDICGKAAGISMEDQLPGNLTPAFSMLIVGADGLEGVFDSRCPICATEESALGVIKQAMVDHGLTLESDFMIPPHRVNGNSHFVKTLLSVCEDYTGPEGDRQATGGGTYIHSLKDGVAYGATPPGTDNRMHGADELAVVDELVLSAEILAQAIVELCS